MSREPQLTNYTLPVRAADDGRCPGCPNPGTSLQSEIVNIEVEVMDRNLVAPEFTACPSVMTLSEMASAGTNIGTVTATDKDDPSLASIRLRYELIGNTVFARPTLYLQVDSQTGAISNVRPLIRTPDQFGGVLLDQLYFTVAAYDWGEPCQACLAGFLAPYQLYLLYCIF